SAFINATVTPNANDEPAAAPSTQVTPEISESTTPLATREVRILTPTPGTVLDVPAATVILQFTEGSAVNLQVNGVAVDPSLVGRTETDKTTKIVTQTWYDVALQEGENTITAQATTNGVTSSPSSVTAQVRGEATQLRVETVEAQIPADGRSTATIQGQLLDANGNRSNRNGVVTLVTNGGEFVGTDYDRDQVGWQVQARQGQFTATLQSQLRAQTLRVRATSGELEAYPTSV
ncbi:MAG: TonB-dependent receptor, partial [Microcoleus sp. SIO2G3]|nr:TonB-dependent receptor [Microcoleus sp. SIO2G3]